MFNYIPCKRLLTQSSVLWGGGGVTGPSSAFNLGQPRSGLQQQLTHPHGHRGLTPSPTRQTHGHAAPPAPAGEAPPEPARRLKREQKKKKKKKSLPNSGCVPDQRSSPARPSGPCKCKTKLKALPSPPPTPSAILLLPAGMAKELAKGICM